MKRLAQIACLLASLCVSALPLAAKVKTVNGLLLANVKTVDGLVIAKVKTVDGQATTGGGGGGTDVWYDAETVANTDSTGSASLSATEWSLVTVGAAGTATKARIYLETADVGAGNYKMALYASSGGAPLANGTFAYTGADDAVWMECTFTTPVAVTATTYFVAWSTDSSNSYPRYKAGSGGWHAKLSQPYAGFPYNPLGTADFDLARGYAVSVYVD